MEKPDKTTARKSIASVQKALDILNLFDKSHTELGNAEIARLVDVPIGTASGLIYTLKINHYLDQNPTNRKYRLGFKLSERAAVLLDQLDLRKVAAPLLEELRDWCGESVNLAIRDGNEVVYIERMFGDHALGIRSELGRRGTLHSTALGKAIFSYLPNPERDNLLDGYNFSPVTPYTITDRDKFVAELALTRQRGFAIDEQENELGGRCISAPIRDRQGYPIAAISISVPIQRFPKEAIDEFGRKLIETSELISQRMGYVEG
ncbi:MAG TPA: IclR family transcriptional regulator [Longilinea sp.]|nr:IclR family transcriptional regulator [Longilinea sp.]